MNTKITPAAYAVAFTITAWLCAAALFVLNLAILSEIVGAYGYRDLFTMVAFYSAALWIGAALEVLGKYIEKSKSH